MRIRLPHNYQPRSYHRRIYAAWQAGCRHLLLVIHRRGGKTESLVAFAPQLMLARMGNYAHVFPLLKQAREVVWDGIGRSGQRYLEHFPASLLYCPPNKGELKVTLRDATHQNAPGSTYQLYGTDHNLNALVGSGHVGVIWDEYALQNPQARDLARPILAEANGWEIVPFTPRGENHGYDLYRFAQTQPDWHVEYLTVNDTRRDAPGEDGSPVITDEAIAAHRAELLARGVQGVDSLIEQEYYLSWTAPMPGAYWADELSTAQRQGRICPVMHDPSKRVFTAWDLGTSKAHDTNAIWFCQLAGNRVQVIDYHQASNKGIPYYVQMLEGKGYTYGAHYAMESDLAEADWGSGKTRGEQLAAFGVRFLPVPKLKLVDSIASGRMLIPRCNFDAGDAVRVGLNGLRSFKREWDAEKKIFKDKPLHDWASHPASAWRYLAVAMEQIEHVSPPRGAQSKVDFDVFAVGRSARPARTDFSVF
jgi:hypothetical protein